MANRFLAGVGRALLFKGDDLIGVANTLTESTFDFSITGEEVRGGPGNSLFGKYFHDSNLNVTLTDAMFNLEYMAAALGSPIEQGGLVVYQSGKEGETITTAGSLTVQYQPQPFNGALIGWYKKPSDENWSIAQFSGQNNMLIPGATVGEQYCVKYFYNDPNARSIVIKTQYVPSELHVVIINDLYPGDVGFNSESNIIGHLITDIPRLQMDGSQNLSLTSTGAATINLTGSALAVSSSNTCETDSIYGTMTEIINGATWQSNVIALAIENNDMDLIAPDGKETLSIRAVFGGGMASKRYDNSNFTFTVETGSDSIVSVANTGEVTGLAAGTGYISVLLTGYPNVEPAIAKINVSAAS